MYTGHILVLECMDGVVKFDKQDELSLCFEDEQYRSGSEAAFKSSRVLVHQFALRNVVVEQFLPRDAYA